MQVNTWKSVKTNALSFKLHAYSYISVIIIASFEAKTEKFSFDGDDPSKTNRGGLEEDCNLIGLLPNSTLAIR